MKPFKRIVIELRGPICNCHKQDLNWNTEVNQLVLTCKSCKTKLVVPQPDFVAAMHLEQPYAGGIAQAEPKTEGLDGLGTPMFGLKQKAGVS